MSDFITINSEKNLPPNFSISTKKNEMHKGRSYTIIKGDRHFSNIERIRRVTLACLPFIICTLFLGIFSPIEGTKKAGLACLALISNLFLGIFSERMQKLLTQRTETIVFGIPPLPIDDTVRNHYKDLHQLLTGRHHYKKKDITGAELNASDSQPPFLYINGEKHTLTTLRLNNEFRSSVQIFRTNKEDYLVLPNNMMNGRDDTGNETVNEETLQSWERMVDREITTLNRARQIGLLSSSSKRIEVATNLSFGTTIPAYTYTNFQILAEEKRTFVMDNTAETISTWKPTYCLFGSEKENENPINWYSPALPLLKDIIKIVDNNMLTPSRLSVAIVRSEDNTIFIRCFYGCCRELGETEHFQPLSNTDQEREKSIKDTFESLLSPLIKNDAVRQSILNTLWARAIKEGHLARKP